MRWLVPFAACLTAVTPAVAQTLQPIAPPAPPRPTLPAEPVAARPAPPSLAEPAAAGAVLSATPNLFGDPFGYRPLSVRIDRGPVVIAPSTRAVQDVVTILPQTGQTLVGFVALGTPVANLTPFVFGNDGTLSVAPTRAFGQTFAPGTVFVPAGTVVLPAPPGTPPAAFALAENAQITGAVAGLARPGEVVVFRQGTASNPRDAFFASDPNGGRSVAYDVAQVYDLVTPGQTLLRPAFEFSIPTPTGGSYVGRTKLSDDNNPLPRDRFILGFDYFDRARVSSRGVDVSRLSPGVEKTFFDGNASVEVRVPFAATLDSDVVAGSTAGRNAELGDVHFTFKALVYRDEQWAFAVGSGLSLPTADDVRVRLANGQDLVRINNDAVLIEPYAAALYAPDDRLFMQAWLVFAFSANSNRVEADLSGLGALALAGRVRDKSLIQPSLQLGYWLHRSDDDTGLTGLAPFVEAHYNASLGGGTTVRSGPFVIDGRRGLDELNLTAGFSALIGQNLQLMTGVSVPVLQGERNRTFDYQIGIRGNVFFGRTAAQRGGSARVSTF